MKGKLANIVMLNLGVDINLFPTKTWIKLGSPPMEPTQYNILLVDGSLVWSLGLLKNILILVLGIISSATFDIIDMFETEKLRIYNSSRPRMICR